MDILDFYINNGIVINILFSIIGIGLYILLDKKFKTSKINQTNLMYYKFDLIVISMLVMYTSILIILATITWFSGSGELINFVRSIEYILPLVIILGITIICVLLCYFNSHLKKYGDFRKETHLLNSKTAREMIEKQESFIDKQSIFNTYSIIMLVTYFFICVIFPFMASFIWVLFYYKIIKYSKFKF